jgi:hypothetical protein
MVTISDSRLAWAEAKALLIVASAFSGAGSGNGGTRGWFAK